jgi:uncharacterized membrane protein (UPF0127 family)
MYQCGFQKVCGVPIIDRMIRNHMTVVAPLGTIDTEVVDTKPSRELGLSGRGSLPKDGGMLFGFDRPGVYGFWMKDMKFSLDLIWIDSNGQVVTIERDVKPETYPTVFKNSVNALYVLEIAAGEAEKKGIFLGSKVKMVD